MSVTSPLVLFGTNALAIKDDIASITASDSQPFVDLTDLEGEVAQNKYITYEPDMWQLDGSYHFLPAVPHVGFMGTVLSGLSGLMASPPEITITFNSVYSTSGLTIYMPSGTHEGNVEIIFYDASDVIITSNFYEAIGNFSTGLTVNNFKKIKIAINNVGEAYRFARLTGIDFDTLTRFDDSNIQEARLSESISPLSVELPYNILDLTLYSAAAGFSVVAPSAFYAELQENAPLDAWERINDNMVYMGRFYLETWDSQSENLATFKTYDGIGLLEKTQIPEVESALGILQAALPRNYLFSAHDSEDAIANVMDYAGISYTLDASLTGISINAWIPLGSAREVLKQILFAIGAYATCARSKVVEIKPFELASDLVSYDYTLTDTDKNLSSPVNQRPVVHGVELSGHTWSSDGTSVTILSGTYEATTYKVGFDVPHYNVSVTGASGGWQSNYAAVRFILSAPGAITVSGETGKESLAGYRVYVSPLPSVSNIVNIPGAVFIPGHKLVSTQVDPQAVTQRVYDYYLQRYIQKTKLTASLLAPGDSVLIDTQSSRQIGGIVEKMITDLAKGCVQDVEIIGDVVPL